MTEIDFGTATVDFFGPFRTPTYKVVIRNLSNRVLQVVVTGDGRDGLIPLFGPTTGDLRPSPTNAFALGSSGDSGDTMTGWLGLDLVSITSGDRETTIIFRASLTGDTPAAGKIAFFSDRTGNWKLYAMEADGTELTLLTKPDAFAPGWTGFARRTWPIGWSPDGGKIAFSSTHGGSKGIFVVNSDGSAIVRLTSLQLDAEDPRWSPTVNDIAFVQRLWIGQTSSSQTDIFVVSADGSALTQLTDTIDVEENHPVWSPDGAKIAFRVRPKSFFAGTADEVHIMNADGSGKFRLSNAQGFAFGPEWSPDGSKIAFLGPGVTSFCIYVINVDGSNQQCLVDARNFSWSPDGSKIAFDSSKDGVNSIYKMDPDGSNEERLTSSISHADSYPTWSPDGTRIAFVSTRDGNGGPNLEIYVMNADGSEQTRLTNDGAFDEFPSWSPGTPP